MKGPGGVQKFTSKDRPLETPPSSAAIKELLPSMQYLTKALSDEIKNGKLEVHLDARGLVISLRQAAFFPSGGDEISPEGTDSLAKIATTIRDLPNPVRLEGHTDSIPIHNDRFRSNWELSAARSIAMLNIFSERFSIPRDRFSVAGYAETKPIASNESVDGRAKNRRVDIVILNQSVVASQASEEPAAAANPSSSRPPVSTR
jgi:chemotaxis protein MotB